MVDSTADLPKEWLVNHPEIIVIEIPILVTGRFSKVEFPALSREEYRSLRDSYSYGYTFSSCLPKMMDKNYAYKDSVATITAKAVASGEPVVYLATSCGHNNTYESAAALFADLRQTLHLDEQHLAVVDTECTRSGVSSLILHLYDAIEVTELRSVEPIVNFVTERRQFVSQISAWTDPSYLLKNGGVSILHGLLAKMTGEIFLGTSVYRGNVRHNEVIRNPHIPIRTLDGFARIAGSYIRRHYYPDSHVIIHYGERARDAKFVATKLRDFLPQANVHAGDNWNLSAANQVYTGPDIVQVTFMSNLVPRYRNTLTEIGALTRSMIPH